MTFAKMDLKIRILTAILFIALLCFQGTAVYAKTFADTVGKPSESSVIFLNDIGILEGKTDDNFEPDANLTRAEMAAIIVRMHGIEMLSASAMSFNDVPSSHWAYAHISTAYNLGIVNGVDETHFSPDENLTLPQAVKMLVYALGYGIQAENMGGYPSGYLAKGSQLGILKSVSDSSGFISRGDMAILVNNSVNCNILVRTGYGSAYTFVEKEGATILSEYLHIDKYEGRITGNEYKFLSTVLKARRGQIIVDSTKRYEVGTTNAEEMVGMKVTIYSIVKDGEANPTILFVKLDDRSKVLKINAADINKNKTTANRVFYQDGYTERNVSFAYGNMVIYNGETSDTLDIPNEGSLTLICDNGSEANVIFVDEYANLIVKGKNAESNVIYIESPPFGFDYELVLDNSDISKTIRFINADGTESNVSECTKWNVLSVSRSKSHNVYSVVRSESKIAGKITEYSSEAVTIGGVNYRIDKTLLNSVSLTKPSFGTLGMFYLDAAGKIAAVDTSADAAAEASAEDGETLYGYVVSSGITKGLDGIPQIKLYTQDGKMVTYNFGRYVSIVNGTQWEKSFTYPDFKISPNNNLAIETGSIDLELTPQLILFDTNKSQEIIKIRIHTVAQNERERLDFFSLDETLSARTIFHGGDLRTFLSRYYVGDECVIFNLPESQGSNEKDYRVMLPSELVHGAFYKNMQFYDITEENSISVIVMSAAVEETVGNDAMIGIVTDVYKGIDEDGETVNNLSITNHKGEKMSYYTDSDFEVLFGTNGAAQNVITDSTREVEKENGKIKNKIKPEALDKGDVVAYEVSGRRILNMAVRFRAKYSVVKEMIMDSGVAKTPTKDSAYSSQIFWFNKVESVSFRTMKAHMPAISGTEPYWVRVEPLKSAKVMQFDIGKGMLTMINADDIQVNSMVFVYRTTLYPKMIVVYK